MNVMEDFEVVIITLNYNQNSFTLDCVNSLIKSDYANIKIVVIDNGSSVEIYEELSLSLPKDSRILLQRINENIGYVGGVNYGLEYASSLRPDYFMIMNNDTLIDSRAITQLVDCAARYNDGAIVSGKVYNYDGSNTLQFIGNVHQEKGGILDFKGVVENRREEDNGQYDYEIEMAMLDDIFWLIPKKIFDVVGLYSTYFFLYGEQTDYALRAVKSGFKLVYTPKAKLWHKGGITTDGGKTWLQSPRVEYWGTLAVLKLSVLHYTPTEASSFYRRYAIKTVLKKTMLLLRGKIQFSILRANYMAIRDFKFWNRIRYRDNGYNPF